MCLISVTVMICYATPFMVALFIPVAVIYMLIQKYHIRTSLQLQRLRDISRSPIFSHFNEALNGISTIRAFNRENIFIQEFESQVNSYAKGDYTCDVMNSWLAIRLELLSSVIIFYASIVAVMTRNTTTAGLTGLTLSYALDVTGTLSWLLQMMTYLENNLVGIERIMEYARKEPEAPWSTETDEQLGPFWPSQGEVLFKEYSTRYRPGLELVLRDVNIHIQPGEKIGIAGRTGAGKSSLTLALFRLIEASNGHILIDNAKISQLGLKKLRQNITIIPQDPVLFTGSLR